jgi:hypothetical protein
MPLFLTLRGATNALPITSAWVGLKPATTNPTWTTANHSQIVSRLHRVAYPGGSILTSRGGLILDSAEASEGISGSYADILAHREALWTFIRCEGVEPTNNHAELELRDFVLWRRRSFGSRSERGDRFAERVMTVVRTARKQGLAVLDFLVRSITAHVDNTAAPRLLGAAA